MKGEKDYQLRERSITLKEEGMKNCQAAKMSGVQCLRKASLQNYHGSIFADVCNHVHYTLYNNYAYFVGLILGDSSLSAKISAIWHHNR